MANSQEMINQNSIATLQANYANLKESIIALSTLVASGNNQSTQQNLTIIERLAVLNSKQDGFSSYQASCDAERKTLREDVNNLKVKAGLLGAFFGTVTGAITVAVCESLAHKIT